MNPCDIITKIMQANLTILLMVIMHGLFVVTAHFTCVSELLMIKIKAFEIRVYKQH